jgi:hypothetical protein
MISAGARLTIRNRINLEAVLSTNVSDPGDPMQDSDWGQYGHNPETLTTFSESDAALDSFTLDTGGAYRLRVMSKPRAHLFVLFGGGVVYQDIDWEASNLDQWYPAEPWWPHDRVDGLVGTYSAEIVMPFFDTGLRLEKKKFDFEATLHVTPYLSIEARDDHVLRSLLSEIDASGSGFRLIADVEFGLTARLFGSARLSFLDIQADGRLHSRYYAGPHSGISWSIDEEITSTQIGAFFGVGYQFGPPGSSGKLTAP